MGEKRLARAWRVVRRPSTTRGGAVAAAAGRGDGYAPMARRRIRRDPSSFCGASGWQLRAGCGDGDGGTICPLCSRRVRTVPDAVADRSIEVIEAHCA
ncbi:MAG TPA: hypothetical protein VF015_05235 [Acidimicrobiales bacterium]